jgi:hypothetical protein
MRTIQYKWYAGYFIGLVCSLLLFHPVYAQLQVENLGEPVRSEVSIEFLTRDKRYGTIAWAGFAGADRYGVVGVHTVTGAVTEVDLSSYGKTIRPWYLNVTISNFLYLPVTPEGFFATIYPKKN